MDGESLKVSQNDCKKDTATTTEFSVVPPICPKPQQSRGKCHHWEAKEEIVSKVVREEKQSKPMTWI